MTTKRPPGREADVLRQCQQLLHLRKCLFWRNNTGALVVGAGDQRRLVRFGKLGGSDLLCVLPSHCRRPGVLLCVEVKRPGGRLTYHQQEFLDLVAAQCAETLVCDDVMKLDELLTDLGV